MQGRALRLSDALFPKGRRPLETPLLSLKERSKEANSKKLRFLQELLTVPAENAVFSCIKVLEILKNFF